MSRVSRRRTPIHTAFKGIRLQSPEQASNCGVVNIATNRGHVDFQEGPQHRCGGNRLVYGCILRNAAVADTQVPDRKSGQRAWQRFTQRHRAAVSIKSAQNVLVANNRLPKSGEDNFTMKDYLLKDGSFDVVFDYDNRPGLYVNDYAIADRAARGRMEPRKPIPGGSVKGPSSATTPFTAQADAPSPSPATGPSARTCHSLRGRRLATHRDRHERRHGLGHQ